MKPYNQFPLSSNGYKDHRIGSRKERAHKLFDKMENAAKSKVLKMGIKESTIRQWFSSFRGPQK
jgi:hypothetical protein